MHTPFTTPFQYVDLGDVAGIDSTKLDTAWSYWQDFLQNSLQALQFYHLDRPCEVSIDKKPHRTSIISHLMWKRSQTPTGVEVVRHCGWMVKSI